MTAVHEALRMALVAVYRWFADGAEARPHPPTMAGKIYHRRYRDIHVQIIAEAPILDDLRRIQEELVGVLADTVDEPASLAERIIEHGLEFEASFAAMAEFGDSARDLLQGFGISLSEMSARVDSLCPVCIGDGYEFTAHGLTGCPYCAGTGRRP